MANTIQKKIKFSKGQIVPELVERTDLEMYDSSAQLMKNVVCSVYGGVRSRRGTKKIDRILGGYTDVSGTASSGMGGTASNIQNKDTRFVTGKIGNNRNIFTIQYGTEQTGGLLKVRGIKIDYQAPTIVGNLGTATGTYDYWERKRIKVSDHYIYIDVKTQKSFSYYYYKSITIKNAGVGLTSADKLYPNPKTGWTYPTQRGLKGDKNGTSTPSFTLNLSNTGAVSSVTIGNGGKRYNNKPSTSLIFERKSSKRSYKASLYVSADGNTWTKVQTKTLSETSQDFDFQLTGRTYSYVKMDLDATNDNIATTMSLQYAALFNGSYSKVPVKLVDFLYNNSDKYVLMLTNEHIDVFKDDEVIAEVVASGLSQNYFKELKWAYKDDTIIFTHPSMPPKILKRMSDGSWTWSNLSISNIPYTTFTGETTTTKSVGITPSDVEGTVKITADSSVFDSGYVGQMIDGNGGRVKITEYVSGTVVNGYTIIPFYTKDKISSWKYISGYEAVWSATRGYPRTCLFAQQRLWFGGSRDKPATVWASRLGDYFNFKNSGNYDNDSIDVDLLTNDVIVNMVDNRGVHIFTTGQEITAQEGTYTPDKISFTVNTQNGSLSCVHPVIIGGAVCFVEKNGKSLLSYVYNYEQASYLTDNMSLFTNLVNNPVAMTAEINSAKDKGDFLYMVLSDGTMLVGCIYMAQNIMSLSQFVTDGTIEDVCSIGGDTYIIVDRGNYKYIEKIESLLTDITTNMAVYPDPQIQLYGWENDGNVIYTESETPSVGDSIVDVWLDDSGDTISAVAEGSITVNGTEYTREDESNDTMSTMYVNVLSDYEGKRVILYNGNDIYANAVVSDGRLYLDVPVNDNCYLGVAYQYEIVGNPIAINHKTTSIKKRITTAELVCEDTPRIKFCGQEKERQHIYKFYSCTKYDNDVRYKIEGEFYPMQILSIQLNINYEG